MIEGNYTYYLMKKRYRIWLLSRKIIFTSFSILYFYHKEIFHFFFSRDSKIVIEMHRKKERKRKGFQGKSYCPCLAISMQISLNSFKMTSKRDPPIVANGGMMLQ